MRKFECKEYGRVIVLPLGKGELLLETISEELKKSGVNNAILTSGIGSLCKLEAHAIGATSDQPCDYYISEEKPIELGGMQGSVLNGVPHIHMVCSAPGGETFVGHLEPGCRVQYLVEMSFIEVKDMQLTRRADEHGIGYIDRL